MFPLARLCKKIVSQFSCSGLCELHHHLCFKDQISDPKLSSFINDPKPRSYFYQFLCIHSKSKGSSEAKSVNMFHFLRAVKLFQETDRKLRRKKAEVLIQKYLNAKNTTNFIGISDEMITKVKKTMEESDCSENAGAVSGLRYGKNATFNAPPKDTFDDISKECEKRLMDVFKNGYLRSGIHRLYVATIKLPPYHQQMALDRIALENKTIKGTSNA
mmetsp:Transcript_18097/g.32397  ORF Transcript_18097/g.32397 Transcript_18097/m.32397 type:complete len:216 (-) Transcript_18097:283-930(-)